MFPDEFANTGIHDLLIGIKNDPFCFKSFPGPNSTFDNCYMRNEGALYYDWPNRRMKFVYNRWWSHILSNMTQHIYHNDGNDEYMMNIVIKKFMLGIWDFCVCADPKVGVVAPQAFRNATYVGRERIGVEYIWQFFDADHWVKGPHHF